MKEFNGYNIPSKAKKAAAGNINGVYYLVGRKWFYLGLAEAKDEAEIKLNALEVCQGMTAKEALEHIGVCANMRGGVVEL